MDESWRMRMGMPSSTTTTTTTTQLNVDSRRRSTEDCRRMITGEPSSILLQPQDFNDVFGGPPRIVIARQLSSGIQDNNNSSRSSFYDTVFQPPEDSGTVPTRGRNLPEFKIPMEKTGRRSDQGFYTDIFGWDEEDEVRRLRTRSGSKSKASSTSALSSEELSPLQAASDARKTANDDVSLFASRLRPINIPSRWTSTKIMDEEENDKQQDEMPAAGTFPWSYLGTNQPHERRKGSNNSGYCPGNSSPETISLEPDYSYGSVKLGGSDDYLEPNSPLSVVSCQEEKDNAPACKTHDEMLVEDHGIEQDDDDDYYDEVMNSYVIEINSDYREQSDDAIGVDEAIAWAKEKFQKQYPESTWKGEHKPESQSSDAVEEIANRDHQVSDRQKIDSFKSSDTSSQVEMDLLEETVKLWSTGKESDIRLLLSTLHYILWPNSGWAPVVITTLIESAHVKKAYQKARLCLHPDKLQQRGATLPQKYIAEKAFSILQEAWDAFMSRDVSQR